MPVRLRSLALTSAAMTTLAMMLPAAAAVAEPHQPNRAGRSGSDLDRAFMGRLSDAATKVPRADLKSTHRLRPGATGQPRAMTTAQENQAEAAGLGSASGSGTISASTDDGTWHFDYAPGLWSPNFVPSEINTSWSPGGDRYSFTTKVEGNLVTHVTDPWSGERRDYSLPSASQGASTWGTTGDSFLTKLAPTTGVGSFFTQSTTPSITTAFDAGPEHGPAALYPLGGEGYTRVALTGSTSDIAWFPYAQTEPVEATTFTPLGLSGFHPGNPAVAQAPAEALGGASPLDSVPTYLAFLGVDPENPAFGHLYVDHQESFPERAPVPVADFTANAECDLPAPAFTPDRRTIVFATAEGEISDPCLRTALRSVTVGANGRFDATDAVESLEWWSDMGKPYRTISVRDDTLPLVDAYRISGPNRYAVGVAASQSFFGDHLSEAVVVSGGLAYADALAGGPLAGVKGGPVLLTYPTALHPGVAAEIDRVLAPGGTVYITGGTASVSPAVETALKKAGRTVTRLAGANRYEVAVNIAKEMDRLRGGAPNAAFVAGGTAFADALVAGPAATHEDGPILLATATGLTSSTLAYLDSVDDAPAFKVYGVGGAGSRAVTSRPNDVPVTGTSRFDVALAVANRFFTGEGIAALADGRNWPDAVAGGAAMSSQDMPIMLVNGTTLPGQTANRIKQSAAAVDMVLTFGGPASVPDAPMWAAADLAGTQTPLWGPDTGN